MSINLNNPQTLLEKMDAADNHVAQIRIALMVGDKSRALESVEKAARLISDAVHQIQMNEGKQQ